MLKRLSNIFSQSNRINTGKLDHLVDEINNFESQIKLLSDNQLRGKTKEFQKRLQESETLDEILAEAFAVVREASNRTTGMRHFDVQLTGGIVLHLGKIAEMKTGEGKTLVATLPIYLNALLERGVHLVTVNDYLARRDTQWMGAIYYFLGLSVSCLQQNSAYLLDPSIEEGDSSFIGLRSITRKEAYEADITYGTNNEFGFDYLRDNMVDHSSHKVQRELYFAIVDEVDNILIDEARTPLIISGPAQESSQLYSNFAKLVPRLSQDEDYTIDEKHKIVSLSESGIGKMETWLKLGNLYDPENYHLIHYIENALRAEVIFKRDRDYVVKDGDVVIVDEFTGRMMAGRRYSDGLHQSIEAKEGVRVQKETITYATITLQNYFRMYQKLSGMTGTAATEAEEFWKIYKLDVSVIPTNQSMLRQDKPDFVYQTDEAKFRAIIDEIVDANKRQQPVLVGTTDIVNSERIGVMLDRRGIKHQVLNAKHHEKEASIISQAGRPGAVTVATNMAGRGTDIVLGGNSSSLNITQEVWQVDHDKVISLGGLYIIGTERHEARRIDNQLRGRSGRQGDPGVTRFYISLEDDLMKRFGGERIKGLMSWAKMDIDTPIENKMVTKSLESAQVKVEAHHFEMRKHLVEFDDVINKHREVIYMERNKVLVGSDLQTNIKDMISNEIKELVTNFLSARDVENWDIESFTQEISYIFPVQSKALKLDEFIQMEQQDITDYLINQMKQIYSEKEFDIGNDDYRNVEKAVMLRTIDSNWVEHITAMENLRQGIGLHAYGQRDPLVMFKREGFKMFEGLLSKIQRDVSRTIFRVDVTKAAGSARSRSNHNKNNGSNSIGSVTLSKDKVKSVQQLVGQKIKRNDPCHCGSGKKYKKCHGV